MEPPSGGFQGQGPDGEPGPCRLRYTVSSAACIMALVYATL